jgi:hypothetical protein
VCRLHGEPCTIKCPYILHLKASQFEYKLKTNLSLTYTSSFRHKRSKSTWHGEVKTLAILFKAKFSSLVDVDVTRSGSGPSHLGRHKIPLLQSTKRSSQQPTRKPSPVSRSLLVSDFFADYAAAAATDAATDGSAIQTNPTLGFNNSGCGWRSPEAGFSARPFPIPPFLP